MGLFELIHSHCGCTATSLLFYESTVFSLFICISMYHHGLYVCPGVSVVSVDTVDFTDLNFKSYLANIDWRRKNTEEWAKPIKCWEDPLLQLKGTEYLGSSRGRCQYFHNSGISHGSLSGRGLISGCWNNLLTWQLNFNKVLWCSGTWRDRQRRWRPLLKRFIC